MDAAPPPTTPPPTALCERLLDLWPQQEPQYAVLCIDLDGVVVGVSGAATRVLGYQRNELLGQPIAILFNDHDLQHRLDRHEREVALSAGSSEDDRWHVRKDGSRVWMGGSLTAIRDSDGLCIGFVKVLRNRTDWRAQIESLENRVAALREALQHKDRELTTLAHELANPLGPLTQACHLLDRTDPSEAPRLHAVIGRQLEILRRLVGDLRDLVGPGHPPHVLAVQSFVLQELLQQLVQSCQESAHVHGLTLELLASEVPLWLEADPSRVYQIVLNLVTNAIKYTPAGGRIWVKATVEADSAVVRVEDTGVGISPDMLPRIFDLFTQEPASRHLSEGGMGVGLAVVKQLVDQHGGTVDVRSDGRGQGSDFTVRLPLVRRT
jgi:two-component system CheB/CheR fusion protein